MAYNWKITIVKGLWTVAYCAFVGAVNYFKTLAGMGPLTPELMTFLLAGLVMLQNWLKHKADSP